MVPPSEWRTWALQAAEAVRQLVNTPMGYRCRLVVLGGSMSEVTGNRIGSAHNLDLGREILSGILQALPDGIALAVQGCEHINRALVVEREVGERADLPLVTVWPVPEAGGSLAAAAMELMKDPVVVAGVQAQAGLDIGQTLIGMHLKPVAVPVRLGIRTIGHAVVTAAVTRPPLVGGARARHERPGLS